MRIIFVFIVLVVKLGFSQSLVVEGVVKAGDLRVIENVTVFAVSEMAKPKYTISNAKGEFKLLLPQKAGYIVSFSCVGYKTVKIKASDFNSFKEIVLEEDENILDEIIINHRIEPIVVKKDTIIFNASDFAKMSDRKLRDLLTHIPTLEVTPNGDVLFQGKKVSKMLVEGKKFFNGGTKLAVNNLPADAVKKIEIIEDYHNVAMMKEVGNSDKIAINIKLKEDKKNFVFGSIEGAKGNKEFYDAHLGLFYYNPKNSIASISRQNNIGNKSSNISDFIDEGSNLDSELFYVNTVNYSYKFRFENLSSLVNGYSSANYNHNSKDNELSVFLVSSKMNSKMNSNNKIDYFVTNGLFDNRLSNEISVKESFVVGLNYSKKPKNNDYALIYNFSIGKNSNKNNNNIISETLALNNVYHFENRGKKAELSSSIELHKSLKKRDKVSFGALLVLSNNDSNNDYYSNNQFLSDYLGVIQSDEYNITEGSIKRKKALNVKVNYYKIFDSKHQLHFLLNSENDFQTYEIKGFQYLVNQGSHYFPEVNNDLDYTVFRNGITLSYQYKTQENIFSISLENVNIHSKSNQLTSKGVQKEWLLLPRISYKYKFNKTKFINAGYDRRYDVPNIVNINNKLKIGSYSYVFQGSENLRNQLHHNMFLGFSNYNVFNGVFYKIISEFEINERSNELATSFADSNQLAVYQASKLADYSLKNKFTFEKIWSKMSIKYKINYSYGNDLFYIDGVKTTNEINSVVNSIRFKTDFDKKINVTFTYSNRQSFSKINDYKNSYKFSTYSLEARRVFKDRFHFSTYGVLLKSNDASDDSFVSVDAELMYKPINRPFSVGVSFLNLTNNKNKFNTSLSNVSKSSYVVDVMPLRSLLYISYKF
ncbi:MAG: hypothetical protein ACPG45_03455 [Flavobacteriaceae bacterium]